MAFHRCAPVWMCVFVESEWSKTPVVQSELLSTCIQSHKSTKWKSYTSLNKVRINLTFCISSCIRSSVIANNSGKTSATFKIMEPVAEALNCLCKLESLWPCIIKRGTDQWRDSRVHVLGGHGARGQGSELSLCLCVLVTGAQTFHISPQRSMTNPSGHQQHTLYASIKEQQTELTWTRDVWKWEDIT